jgi:hypothetical protein
MEGAFVSGGDVEDYGRDEMLPRANRKKTVTAKRRKELLQLACDFAGQIDAKNVLSHERNLFLQFVDIMSTGEERA